jgi:hypothetical protein
MSIFVLIGEIGIEKVTYAGIPEGRTTLEIVVAACALAMNESTRVDVSFMLMKMKVQQDCCSSER